MGVVNACATTVTSQVHRIHTVVLQYATMYGVPTNFLGK